MSLIEEYYELNEAEDVSGMWKVMILTFYVLAGCIGLWCGCTIAVLRNKFGDKCYLFTEVKLPPNQKPDINNINWANDALCDFCQYSMVASFIVGLIWATFFLICGKGGKSLTGLPQPWRIVCPSLMFNFIFFLLTLGAAINIQNGTDQFCGKRILQNRRGRPVLEFCTVANSLIGKDLQVTKFHIDIVSKTSWGCAASWLVLFLLAFFRIIFVADFQMYKICVFKLEDTVKNEREEILRITTYEEPRKLRPQEEKYKKVSFFGKDDDMGSEIESLKRKDTALDKNYARQNFNAVTNIPLPPKTFFYMSADIRNLNRDKKRKKVSKNLNEAFGEDVKKLHLDIRSTPSIEEPILSHRYKVDSVLLNEAGKPPFYSCEPKESDSDSFNPDGAASSYDHDTFMLGSKKYV